MQGKRNLKSILKDYSLLLLLVVFLIISSILSPNFLKPANLLNMLQQCSVPGVIAIGMTLVIILGGIDLSVGAVAALAGMVTSLALDAGWNTFISILLGIAVGMICGVFTGGIISHFGLPDFIVSLATMQIARGLALLVTKGEPIFGLPKDFAVIGGGKIGGLFPVVGLIWIFLTIVIALVLRFTVFGRSLYAIGSNRESATLSGIKTKRNYCLTFVICGALSGFAGVLTASWLKTGQPTACTGYELDAIAASVIGGASMSGGIGTIIGTFGGVVLLQIITNIFNLVGMSSFYQQIAKGVIIIIALLMNKLFTVDKNQCLAVLKKGGTEEQ